MQNRGNKDNGSYHFTHTCLGTSGSLQPHDCSPPRLLCSWNFPGKNSRTGCHFLLQRIFPIQGSNLSLLYFLHWQADSQATMPPGKPSYHLSLTKGYYMQGIFSFLSYLIFTFLYLIFFIFIIFSHYKTLAYPFCQ